MKIMSFFNHPHVLPDLYFVCVCVILKVKYWNNVYTSQIHMTVHMGSKAPKRTEVLSSHTVVLCEGPSEI